VKARLFVTLASRSQHFTVNPTPTWCSRTARPRGHGRCSSSATAAPWIPTHAREIRELRAFERSGELERRFGVSSARIVTVANTTDRASALLNLVAKTPTSLLADYRDRFLFTAEEAYREYPSNVLARFGATRTNRPSVPA